MRDGHVDSVVANRLSVNLEFTIAPPQSLHLFNVSALLYT